MRVDKILFVKKKNDESQMQMFEYKITATATKMEEKQLNEKKNIS